MGVSTCRERTPKVYRRTDGGPAGDRGADRHRRPAERPGTDSGWGPEANPLVKKALTVGQVDFRGLKPEGFLLKTIEVQGRPALVIGGSDEAGDTLRGIRLAGAARNRLSNQQRHHSEPSRFASAESSGCSVCAVLQPTRICDRFLL